MSNLDLALKLAMPALLATVASPASAAVHSVADEATACTVAKARYAAGYDVSPSRIAFCDHIRPEANPPGFYVLGLHSTRQCEEPCSRLMGWFAIEKSTGRMFEWNVADWKLGPELRRRP